MNAFWCLVREIYSLRETLTKNFVVNSTNVTESNERTNTRTNEQTNRQTSRRKLYTPQHKCRGYKKKWKCLTYTDALPWVPPRNMTYGSVSIDSCVHVYSCCNYKCKFSEGERKKKDKRKKVQTTPTYCKRNRPLHYF